MGEPTVLYRGGNTRHEATVAGGAPARVARAGLPPDWPGDEGCGRHQGARFRLGRCVAAWGLGIIQRRLGIAPESAHAGRAGAVGEPIPRKSGIGPSMMPKRCLIRTFRPD